MALIRWRSRDAINPFVELQDEVNRLFDLSSARSGAVEALWAPSLDVFEEKESLVVKADLPGMKEDEVDISIQGDMLVLRGERKHESEAKEKGFYRCERVYGTFQRAVALPYPVDQSKAKATYENGVLEIRLPKAEEAKQKKIRIEVQK